MLLFNRLSNINAQIEFYQEQIAALQQQVTQLQLHAQEVQGAEQAADSALVQVGTALQMLNGICPEEVTTFKAAIDALFNSPLQITAATEPDAPVSPQPPAPSDEPPAVQDAVFEETPPSDAQSPIPNPESEVTLEDPTPNSNGHNGNGKGDASDFQMIVSAESNGNSKAVTVGENELKQQKRPILIRLANLYGIPDFNSKSRDELAKLLSGKVTRENLNRQLDASKSRNLTTNRY
jgi:hypothetical protein